MVDLAPLLLDEQQDVATFIEELSNDELSNESLCAGWTIENVAAHLLANLGLSMPTMIFGTIAAGFRPNRFIARHAKAQPRSTPAEVAAELRSKTGSVRSSDLPVFFVDTLVHHQDMRRPLGRSRTIPDERLQAGLETLITLGFPFGGKKRAKGLRLEATDVDWARGDGLIVAGPAEALLLALAGRSSATAGLSGDGAPILQGRLSL